MHTIEMQVSPPKPLHGVLVCQVILVRWQYLTKVWKSYQVHITLQNLTHYEPGSSLTLIPHVQS